MDDTRKRTRRSFGALSKLPSGRYRARYKHAEVWHNAPHTFNTKMDAEGWLASERRLIDLEAWVPPREREENARREAERQGLTFGDYFERFTSRPGRSVTTRGTYRSMYRNGIEQKLGALPLVAITKQDINAWWGWLWQTYPTRKTRNADSYTLVASVFNQAIEDELITVSPCKVRNAGKKPDHVEKALLTTEEVQAVVAAMPKHYRLAVLVAGACALRIGEWSELRKNDVQLEVDSNGSVIGAWLYITRQVREEGSRKVVAETKSKRNRRVPVPNSLVADLVGHIEGMEQGQLLFPNQRGEWTDRRRFNKAMKKAGAVIGRADVSSHDLRHYGGTLYAQSGATTAEAMARLGHSTVSAAMRYQHATDQRARELADRMQVASMPNVVSLEEHKRKEA